MKPRVIILSLAALAGCESDDPVQVALRERPASREASSRAASSAGRWKQAWVEVNIYTAEPGGGGRGNIDFTRTRYVREELVLDDGAAQRRWALRCRAPEADEVARADAAYQVQFAPDGHALAVSADAGATWQYVPLDAGDRIVMCDYLTFRMPWDGAPTTRQWLFKILRETPHASAPEANYDVCHALCACSEAAAEDAEFQVALARQIAGAAPVLRIPLKEPDRLPHLREMARRHAAVRRTYVEALPNGQAALVLEGLRDAAVQEALAEAMGRADNAEEMARSLAVVTRNLGTASPAVVEILAEGVLGEAGLTGLHCLQALMVADPARARETAAKLPGVPCSHGNAPWDADPDVLRLRFRNEGWDVENEQTFKFCCWVTAALR